MTILEQLEQVESRMEAACQKNRLDTFSLLASERWILLRKLLPVSGNEAVVDDARKRTEHWVELFKSRLAQQRKRQQCGGYASLPSRSGHLVNRSL